MLLAVFAASCSRPYRLLSRRDRLPRLLETAGESPDNRAEPFCAALDDG
jgi:hypothetical protein